MGKVARCLLPIWSYRLTVNTYNQAARAHVCIYEYSYRGP